MTEKQAISETKYRVASIILDDLLKQEKIDKKEWQDIKRKLKRKYKPVISCLEDLS